MWLRGSAATSATAILSSLVLILPCILAGAVMAWMLSSLLRPTHVSKAACANFQRLPGLHRAGKRQAQSAG